jgi:hypothetical protein
MKRQKKIRCPNFSENFFHPREFPGCCRWPPLSPDPEAAIRLASPPVQLMNRYKFVLKYISYVQGLKNALVCSSVTSENFKLTSTKFNRAVSVQSAQFNLSLFFFLQLICN